MNDLRVALIQHEILPNDPEGNLDAFAQLLAEANDCDLVVLPEVFTTGFCANARDFAEVVDGRAYQWMAQQAKQLDAVVTGSLVLKHEDLFYNRMVWMRPDGSYCHYDKRHLFRMAGEHMRYACGEARIVIELNGWRVLPQICYDLRFPVWSRNRDDYDLALYVANWPAARELHWNRLLQARAIENLCYVAGVNRIGQDEKQQDYSGDSSVYGPAGQSLVQAKAMSGCFKSVLSAQALQDYRENFPAHMDADKFDLFFN